MQQIQHPLHFLRDYYIIPLKRKETHTLPTKKPTLLTVRASESTSKIIPVNTTFWQYTTKILKPSISFGSDKVIMQGEQNRESLGWQQFESTRRLKVSALHKELIWSQGLCFTEQWKLFCMTTSNFMPVSIKQLYSIIREICKHFSKLSYMKQSSKKPHKLSTRRYSWGCFHLLFFSFPNSQ